MKLTPYPFQDDGAMFLATKRNALLADEMGLGKTVQAVLAADRVGAKKINVICPAVARRTWRREFLRWQRIPRSVSVAESMKDRLRQDADVQVFGYEFVSRDMFERANRPCEALIIDECHYLSNWQAKRTQAVYGRGGAIDAADRVWCLSGTPMRANPSSLWPMLASLAPELIQKRSGGMYSYEQFVRRFCKGYHHQGRFIITGGDNLEELGARIAPFMLRRRASDALPGLPGISFSDYELDVEPKALPGFEPDPEADDEDVIRKVKSLGDQSEWCEDLGAIKGAASAAVIADELALDLYDKIVVFGVHHRTLDALCDKLDAFGVVRLDGDTSPREKEKAEREFQENPKVRVFAGNVQAAGVAITLTAAAQIFFAEMDWTPLNNAQAAMRTRRIGQTRRTFVRCATTLDPMDVRMTKALRRKTQAIRGVFGDSIETEMAGWR